MILDSTLLRISYKLPQYFIFNLGIDHLPYKTDKLLLPNYNYVYIHRHKANLIEEATFLCQRFLS